MRTPVLVVALASIPGIASASALTVTGNVTNVTSRWTADGSRIVTEATVHTDAGDIVVSQLGGTVDGLTMREFVLGGDGSEPLARGMRVTLGVTPSPDTSGRMHNAVEGVKVLSYPAGFVRTGPTSGGHYLYWESGCVFITPDDAGTKEIAGDGEFPVIDATIETWNTGINGCSYMQVINQGRKAMEVGRDRVNVIKFRDQSWCRPAVGDDPARCHPDSAAGITTATYVDDSSSDRDGAIVDADVELNGVNFSIAVNGQTLGTQPCLSELQNTLTHELGHLLGLEHTCLATGDPDRVDDQGNAVPVCPGTAAIQETTMFNYQSCGETKKETLDQDDIAGVCSIYPTASDPGSCEAPPDGGGCCNTGRDAKGSFALAFLVGLTWFAGFWRRRR